MKYRKSLRDMKINSTFTKQHTKKDGHIETVPYYYEVSYQ